MANYVGKSSFGIKVTILGVNILNSCSLSRDRARDIVDYIVTLTELLLSFPK
jgi:hypothetical protein